ncbi:MAG: preprotein translocase subunit SecE [Holosporaceae bacterium]|jgi:preprotein translocase subunit SecE|nr:preprotein translocase subunit SecE [Holosporaceae bacterium]
MLSPAEFVSQVRRELQRVTWPTQTETMGMTVAVIVMVICAMVYFFVADSVIYYCLRKILSV